MRRAGREPLRWAVAFCVMAGIGLFLGWTALTAWQRSLIFPAPEGVRDIAAAGLAEAGLGGIVSRRLPGADGTPVEVWRDAVIGTRPVVLMFHGNGDSNATAAPRMRRARDAGFAVVAMEYRGYNGAPGAPSEAALIADANAVLAALEAEGAGPGRVVLWGYSLGAGVAVQLGARHRVRGLVLEAPFLSILDLARDLFPYLPVALLLRDPFRSGDVAPGIRSPTLVLSGALDGLVPAEHGRRLAALVAGARFVLIPGAGHADLSDFPQETDAIDGFLAGLSAPGPALP